MDTLPDHININQQQTAKPVDTDIVIKLIDQSIIELESYKSKSRAWSIKGPIIVSSLARARLITSGLLGYIKALEDTRKA